MVFLVSTNADPQNFETRIPKIVKYFSPYVEIMLFPENLPYNIGFDGSTCPRPHDEYVEIDDRLAKDMGKVLEESSIEIAQIHAPTGVKLGDADDLYFSTLFNFCRVLRDASGLSQLSFNSHGYVLDIDSMPGDTRAEQRVNAHEQIEKVAKMAYMKNLEVRSPCDLLLAENNGIGEDNEPPISCNQSTLKVVDLLPEDIIGRQFISGTTLDVPHGWRVNKCFSQGEEYPNIKWCIEDYECRKGQLPPSATDFEKFIEAFAPYSWSVHIAGEVDALSHKRLHANDGSNNIDYERYVSVLRRHVDPTRRIGVTNETLDSPTPEGFEKMREYYPWLNNLFNG